MINSNILVSVPIFVYKINMQYLRIHFFSISYDMKNNFEKIPTGPEINSLFHYLIFTIILSVTTGSVNILA